MVLLRYKKLLYGGKIMTFWNSLKNIFLLLVLLNVAPLLVENIKSQYRTYFVPNTQIGVITIKGNITDSTNYTQALTNFFQDDAIKAILLKIESSGGACGSCQSLFNEIINLKIDHPKPIITLVENVCTSGGYYIASATDHIIAPGTSIIGGITANIICQTNECTDVNKDENLINKPKDLPDHLKQDIYQQMIEDIAHQRKLSVDSLQSWGQGHSFTANQALKLGLIDQLGSIHTATQVIKTKALIEGELKWVNPPAQSGILNFLGASGSEIDALGNCAKVLKLMILGV